MAAVAVSPGTLPQIDADVSRGDLQCPAAVATGDARLACRYVAGHTGAHKTSYANGLEWAATSDPRSVPQPVQGWYPLTGTGASGPPSGSLLPLASDFRLQTSPSPPPSGDIRVGENGFVHGVDGMLDQIASALTRHAGPMLVRDVLPVVQSDQAMQARVGQAVGQAMSERFMPWIIVGTGALAILAGVEVWRATRAGDQAVGRRRR